MCSYSRKNNTAFWNLFHEITNPTDKGSILITKSPSQGLEFLIPSPYLLIFQHMNLGGWKNTNVQARSMRWVNLSLENFSSHALDVYKALRFVCL